jgi:hypothetical protein
MDISKLPIGTLLIWNAPELFEGYAAQIKSPVPGRVYYPAEVLDKHPTKGVLVRTGKVRNWMGAEQEYLRLPTDADLKLIK